jgi:hypothetical protein
VAAGAGRARLARCLHDSRRQSFADRVDRCALNIWVDNSLGDVAVLLPVESGVIAPHRHPAGASLPLVNAKFGAWGTKVTHIDLARSADRTVLAALLLER